MTTTALDEGYRALPGEIRDIDTVNGHHRALVELPTNLETIDAFRTAWAPNCFAASLARRLPPVLREHLPSQKIGDVTSAQSLPRTTELVAEFDASPLAEASFRDIQTGKFRGWSFKFSRGVHAQHPSVRFARHYVRADMDELSAVSSPAIPNTKTVSLRSQPDTLGLFEAIRDRMQRRDRRSGLRSQPDVTLVPYENPELFLDWVAARAEATLDELVEGRYERYEAMRDGRVAPTPEFQLQRIFARHQPKGPRRCL